MADLIVVPGPLPPPLTNYGLSAEMKEWHRHVVDYIESVNPQLVSVDDKSLRQVVVVGIQGFKGGGGGLFCKKEDKAEIYNNMKAEALKANAKDSEITPGHFLLVRNDWGTAGAKATGCFILWHEFGHALAAHGVGSNVGELSAWRFELQAITAAVNSGLPPPITKEMVWGYLDVRQKGGNYGGAEDLVEILKATLGARPADLSKDYCQAAKSCAVDNLGNFDEGKFKSAMANAWGTQTGPPSYKTKQPTWVLSGEQKKIINQHTGLSLV
jgi:hypothetical protein